MKRHKFIAVLLIILLGFCFYSSKECLCKEKQEKEEKPKNEVKTPLERNIPDWISVYAKIPENKKEATKAKVFEHFAKTAECKNNRPLMIYFFWADNENEGNEEEKPQKDEDKIVEACAIFEKSIASSKSFNEGTADFSLYKCNVKEIDKDALKKLKTKYGLKAPLILIFDATGKKVHSITKLSGDGKALLKKLEAIKKSSEKAVEKALKKEEKAEKKTPKKKEKKRKKKKSETKTHVSFNRV